MPRSGPAAPQRARSASARRLERRRRSSRRACLHPQRYPGMQQPRGEHGAAAELRQPHGTPIPPSAATLATIDRTVVDGNKGSSGDGGSGGGGSDVLLRTAVAVALVAAKRRRLQCRSADSKHEQQPGGQKDNQASRGPLAAAGAGASIGGSGDGWRARAEHLEARLRRVQAAAAALTAAVGFRTTPCLLPAAVAAPSPSAAAAVLSGPREPTAALLQPRLASGAEAVALLGSSDGGCGGGAIGQLQDQGTSALQRLLEPLLLAPLEGEEGRGPWTGRDSAGADALQAAACITADGVLSMEQERASLLVDGGLGSTAAAADVATIAASTAAPMAAATGRPMGEFLRPDDGSGLTPATSMASTATVVAKAKAASLARVLTAIQSLAELAAAAGGGGGSTPAASGSPAGLQAAALRHGGTLPHAAVLSYMEDELIRAGGLAPDVRRAQLRRAVQLLAAIVHSLSATAASTAAAAASGPGLAGLPLAAAAAVSEPLQPGYTVAVVSRSCSHSSVRGSGGGGSGSGDGRNGSVPGVRVVTTQADPASVAGAATAAREQLLQVCLDVSHTVDRLLDTACGGSGVGGTAWVPSEPQSQPPAAAMAAAAVQTLEELLEVPSLGQHVLVGAAEAVRNLGQELSAAAAAAEGAMPAAAATDGRRGARGASGQLGGRVSAVAPAAAVLRRLAAAAVAFNRSWPLFAVLADCVARLPGWCRGMTAVAKPADLRPDYLNTAVQALLAAYSLTLSVGDCGPQTARPSGCIPGAGRLSALPTPRGCSVVLPLYGIAVHECLAATAGALMAVAAGNGEFAGSGLVPCCRTLCARIKQAWLPQ